MFNSFVNFMTRSIYVTSPFAKEINMSSVILPSPWQYFLDVVAAARIKEVEATGIAKEIKLVHYRYDNLKESEVIWSTPRWMPNRLKPGKGYWEIDFDCIGRNFSRKGLTYQPLKVADMIAPKAMIAAGPFNELAKEGLYLDRTTGQYHLLVPKNSNLWNALQHTGYEFSPNFYTQSMYSHFDPEFNADAHIDVNYSCVAGRIYVTWLTKEWPEPPAGDETQPQTFAARMMAAPVVEEELKQEVTPGETLEKEPEVPPVEEVVPEEAREETTEETGPTEVVVQQTSNKNKRR